METMEVVNSEASTSASIAVTEPMEGSSGTNDRLTSSVTALMTVKSDLNTPWCVYFLT